MAKFSLPIKEWAKQQKLGIDVAVRSVVLGVGTSLVYRSPVGNRELWAENKARAAKGLPPLPKGYVGGRFRANWQYGFNTAPNGELEAIDASGGVSIKRVESGASSNPAAGVHYIVNNLPYAQRLEDGHSTQAPDGMVGLTVVEFQSIADRAVKK